MCTKFTIRFVFCFHNISFGKLKTFIIGSDDVFGERQSVLFVLGWYVLIGRVIGSCLPIFSFSVPTRIQNSHCSLAIKFPINMQSVPLCRVIPICSVPYCLSHPSYADLSQLMRSVISVFSLIRRLKSRRSLVKERL